MLVHPSETDLPSTALGFLARQLSIHRQRIGSRRRRRDGRPSVPSPIYAVTYVILDGTPLPIDRSTWGSTSGTA